MHQKDKIKNQQQRVHQGGGRGGLPGGGGGGLPAGGGGAASGWGGGLPALVGEVQVGGVQRAASQAQSRLATHPEPSILNPTP